MTDANQLADALDAMEEPLTASDWLLIADAAAALRELSAPLTCCECGAAMERAATACDACAVDVTERLRGLEAVRVAAEDALDVLSLCTTRNFPAPEDAEVRALGERIGFGALMSAASKTWADHAWETGIPYGSHFVCGPCESTLEAIGSALRAALAAVEVSDG